MHRRFPISDFRLKGQLMTSHPPARRQIGNRQSTIGNGFTFVEVLFAIIILGVGTIMLAGMLPVAIKQSSDTRNDLTGRAVCEAGFAYLQSLAASSPAAFPPTDDDVGGNTLNGVTFSPATNIRGRIVPLSHSVVEANGATATDPLYAHKSMYGSRIFSSDRRFQWLAFYGRETGASTARVVILALRLQNVEAVDRYSALTLQNEKANADNGPLLATAEIIDGGALEADRIVFDSASANDPAVAAADSGAFVIVAASENDTGTGTKDYSRSRRNNGRVFRLGARRTDLDATDHTFDLAPGFDLANAEPGLTGRADGSMNTLPDTNAVGGYPVNATTKVQGKAVQVWVVGRGLANPTAAASAGNAYTGPVQDISVLSADLNLAQ